jgi:hypothetical protein
MAALSDPEWLIAWAELLQSESSDGQTVTCLKSDVRAAINAADDWVVANQTNFNNTLPLSARTALRRARRHAS